jgi:hypothetical protein
VVVPQAVTLDLREVRRSIVRVVVTPAEFLRHLPLAEAEAEVSDLLPVPILQAEVEAEVEADTQAAVSPRQLVVAAAAEVNNQVVVNRPHLEEVVVVVSNRAAASLRHLGVEVVNSQVVVNLHHLAVEAANNQAAAIHHHLEAAEVNNLKQPLAQEVEVEVEEVKHHHVPLLPKRLSSFP